MGLEAATYLSDLDQNNPLAGDKKNQGDDHLRLVKAILKNTLPNADRAFRFPKVVTKSANYNVLATDENQCILCDTTAPFTLTLPAGLPFNGWIINVMKSTNDPNPVFVAPPSGTINSLAKIRCNLYALVETFLWDGATFWWLTAPTLGGEILWHAGAAPNGFWLANGVSLIRTEYPLLFWRWGTIYGSVDGSHFNAPNVLDRFPVGAGLSYGLGATGGESAHTQTVGEMPVHSHGITQNPHDHAVSGGATGALSAGNPAGGGNSPFGIGAAIDVSPANADISINNAGGGAPMENRPPYIGLNPVFRFC